MRLFTLAPSLGRVESLVSIPVLTSHAMVPAEDRAKMGVTEQMIRLSVGIENADDLIADLEHALQAVAAHAARARWGRKSPSRLTEECGRLRRPWINCSARQELGKTKDFSANCSCSRLHSAAI
jgi:citrate lyase beta subunit